VIEVHYGVVRIDSRWNVISEGLRLGPYDTAEEAEKVARQLAAQAPDVPVRLHLQDETGQLRQEEPSR